MNSVRRELLLARGFDAERVALAKVDRINAWFEGNRLDAAVVGVSGGIDSALVLALLMRAKLRRVIAMLLPFRDSVGATRQVEATRLGRSVAETFGAEIWEAPMDAALHALQTSVAAASGLSFDAWSIGQALSVIRSPALYGAAALLQTQGFKSVVVGTTNRDEGAYIGFFGKASDAMVDVQCISDLHKSEVRELARYLGVPAPILDALPSGDVFDGRTDEQMIGATFDDVELHSRLLEVRRSPTAFMPAAAVNAIDKLHQHNRHKYVAQGAAVHLDVLTRGVPGGWEDLSLAGRHEAAPSTAAIPGAWLPPESALIAKLQPFADRMTTSNDLMLSPFHTKQGALVRVVDNVLTKPDCNSLMGAMSGSGKAAPVGVTGIAEMSGVIGSTRATAWAPSLANALFERLRPSAPSIRFFDHGIGFTDYVSSSARYEHRRWRLIGLTPLLRFMRYQREGQHYGHYDAAYDYGDGRRTLMSVVFYLNDALGSGATRFLKDRNAQEALPLEQRDFSDWDREARADEVLARVSPASGRVLLFDHRICHDVERWVGEGDRYIIRADLVFEAIPPSHWSP